MIAREESTLERIYSAARAEFMQKGYKTASLRNIVKTAGVTTGAFYGYYGSKQELYRAMVGTEYDYMMGKFKGTLYAFEHMSIERQHENMGEVGRKCLKEMLTYAHEHHDAFVMLLTRSEGTCYEYMLDEMVEMEIDATHKYYRVLGQLGHTVPDVDKRLEHVLVTSRMKAYLELIIYDIPLDEAEHFVDQLCEFYKAGWRKITE